MTFVKPIRHKVNKNSIVFEYGDKKLSIPYRLCFDLKEILNEVCTDFIKQREFNKKKKNKKSKKIDKELIIKANQLAKAYASIKKKFYLGKRRIKVKIINESDIDFKYFITAISLIDKYDITYKKFIKAQIEGLKFANNGDGAFPTPAQLVTETAETRLLQYLKLNGKNKRIRTAFTKQERETPLNDNSKYRAYIEKIKENVATIAETYYVYDLEMLRNNKVHVRVKKYLKKLKINKK